MTKAFTYIRFSSSVQSKGDSVDRQNEYIEKWLKNHPKVELSDLRFIDKGRSAYKKTHLKYDLGKLLKAVEDGTIPKGSYILVEAIDRLSRMDELTLISIVSNIINKGVTLVTLSDDTEYSLETLKQNQGLVFMLAGKAQQAFAYSDTLSKRMKSVWDNKNKAAANGEGIKRKTPWWITPDPSINVKSGDTPTYNYVSKEDSNILTKIFELYCSGLGQRKILNYLRDNYADKFKNTASESIKLWLVNEAAVGRWNGIDDVYPQAITKELWYQAQLQLEARKRDSKQGQKSIHLLAGLVVCGRCNSNYFIKRNTNGAATMMYCGNGGKSNSKCDNKKGLPLQMLNFIRSETMYDAIEQILSNEKMTEASAKMIVLEGQVEDKKNAIKNLIELAKISGSAMVADELKLESSRLEFLQNELDREVTLTKSYDEMTRTDISNSSIDMLSDLVVLNSVLKQVGYRIICDDTHVEVNFNNIGYTANYNRTVRLKRGVFMRFSTSYSNDLEIEKIGIGEDELMKDEVAKLNILSLSRKMKLPKSK